MKSNVSATPIKINGTNIDLGEALPHKVREEILRLAENFGGRLNHAAVGFTRDAHWYCCIINLQVSNLKMIVAEATAPDCHQAFDRALAKVGRQLHRRKRRMADAVRRGAPAPAFA
jgi:ribosomal subunit interface protein